MDTDNSDWQTATGKKSATAKVATVVDTITEVSSIKMSNSFAGIDNELSDDDQQTVTANESKHNDETGGSDAYVDEIKEEKVTVPISQLKSRAQSWGDMSEEPDVNVVMKRVALDMEKGDDFEQKMSFLRELMGLIASSAASLIETERKNLENEYAANDRDTVRRLHDLSTYGRTFGTSMSKNLGVITEAVDEIEKQMKDILEGWNKFVREITGEHAGPAVTQKRILQRPVQQQSMSYSSALVGNGGPTPVPQRIPTSNTITTSVGIVDIKAPVATDSRDVPLMGIRFNPALGVFMINLEEEVYSFGTGKFIYRKGRNSESTLYGKRCNPAAMTCNEDSCTYYHDPLKFANGHTSRNMAIHYITEDLVKGVASDQDILANDTLDRNPFIVEDLVQLGGMLLLKAMAVKSVLRKTPSRPSRRNARRTRDDRTDKY